MKPTLFITAVVISIMAASTSCVPVPTVGRNATVEAISVSVHGSATADAGIPSIATESTTTPTITLPIKQTQTALPQVDTTATQQALATLAPIVSELPIYDVQPGEGSFGWVHPPVTLEVSGYEQSEFAYSNDFIQTIASDFVMSSDITWNTQYGDSGCGFVIRSNGRKYAWNQYLVIMTRASTGHILFVIMADGKIVSGRDLYAYSYDKNFRWENESTNRLTIVGRGTKFTIYTNQVKIGEIDTSEPIPPPALPKEPEKPKDLTDPKEVARYEAEKTQYEAAKARILADYAARKTEAQGANKSFEHGLMAMAILSESGQASCQFYNTWLWLLN